MKIEMGESLVRSWLRHVEQCEFAELNWKASPTWNQQPDQSVISLFEAASAQWPGAFGTNSLGQLLRQAEIDVLGLNTQQRKLHLVDVAYHSGGLNYGGNEATAERVYKKLIRSILLSKTYFPGFQSAVYFLSPFSSPGIRQAVINASERVRSLVADHPEITVNIFIGEEFSANVLSEVLSLGGEIADTSELFLRSWQLIEPLLKHRPSVAVAAQQHAGAAVAAGDTVHQTGLTLNRELNIAALYLSRFEHSHLHLGNQSETFAALGRRFHVSPNTVRNIRDRFDFYVDNHRVGWNAELPEHLREILNEFGVTPEEELRRMVLASL